MCIDRSDHAHEAALINRHKGLGMPIGGGGGGGGTYSAEVGQNPLGSSSKKGS